MNALMAAAAGGAVCLLANAQPNVLLAAVDWVTVSAHLNTSAVEPGGLAIAALEIDFHCLQESSF